MYKFYGKQSNLCCIYKVNKTLFFKFVTPINQKETK